MKHEVRRIKGRFEAVHTVNRDALGDKEVDLEIVADEQLHRKNTD